MEIKSIKIEGYKSIGNIEISNPNPFTVFVGPNASGKSNIFEALEFIELCDIMNPTEAIKLFGNSSDLFCTTKSNEYRKIGIVAGLISNFSPPLNYANIHLHLDLPNEFPYLPFYGISDTLTDMNIPARENIDCKHFLNFTRLFISQPSRLKKIDDSRICTYGYKSSNLEKVLKRILKDENVREEIFEILQLLIPGFDRVEIVSSELSGTDTLIVYEEALKKPLTKELISDGTYNIIAIIAALYQSDTPQFLCIEEPENGINPFVVKELATIMRNRCKEKGHYIWLNTHSQTLVSQLTTEEIIIVEKIDGLTKIKQIQGEDLFGVRMDEALYTNMIGGGNPW